MKPYEKEDTLPYSTGKPFGAWIGNLGKYNEEILEGEWVRIPTDQKTIDDALVRKFVESITVYDYSITILMKTGREIGMRV